MFKTSASCLRVLAARSLKSGCHQGCAPPNLLGTGASSLYPFPASLPVISAFLRFAMDHFTLPFSGSVLPVCCNPVFFFLCMYLSLFRFLPFHKNSRFWMRPMHISYWSLWKQFKVKSFWAIRRLRFQPVFGEPQLSSQQLARSCFCGRSCFRHWAQCGGSGMCFFI